jgi:hypothetical protein
MSRAAAPYLIEERIICGETRWIAIRARGAEWSWLTPDEAVIIGRAWIEKYGQTGRIQRQPKARKIGNNACVETGSDLPELLKAG